MKWSTAVILSSLLPLALPRWAQAQLKGHYIPGFTGLQSGSQAPPSINLLVPVYFYTTDDIRDDNGNSLGSHPQINAWFTGLGLAWVTNVKILGANLGGSVIPVDVMKSRIEGPSLDVPGNFAFSDITVQPIQLGWHTKRVDYVAGYSLFLPTGKWALGADDNAGLGMWSHDLQAGTTVYLDQEKGWSVSALATYELHTHKKDTDIKVGDIFTVEGGLGKTWYQVKMMGETPVPTRLTNFGIAYYAQFKVTGDEGGGLTPFLQDRKDRVYGVGLEGSMIWPESGWVLGLRVEPEFGARNRTQGWTVLFNVAYQVKSLAKEP